MNVSCDVSFVVVLCCQFIRCLAFANRRGGSYSVSTLSFLSPVPFFASLLKYKNAVSGAYSDRVETLPSGNVHIRIFKRQKKTYGHLKKMSRDLIYHVFTRNDETGLKMSLSGRSQIVPLFEEYMMFALARNWALHVQEGRGNWPKKCRKNREIKKRSR